MSSRRPDHINFFVPPVPGDEWKSSRVPRAARAKLARRRAVRRRMVAATLVFVGLVTVSGWLRSGTVSSGVAASRGDKRQTQAAQSPTPVFTSAQSTGLSLRLPAKPGEVTAVGYHQAYNPKSYPLVPTGTYIAGQANKAVVSDLVSRGMRPSFVMYSRGRLSSPTSSVDVVMPVGSPVISPVSGRVRAVVPYKLYGRMDDIRLEIIPDGHPELVVTLVHITDIRVSPGQRVKGGVTPLAILRPLGIKSQIDEYTGLVENHVHIQVNPVVPQPARPRPVNGGR